jgi:hypothetical protein
MTDNLVAWLGKQIDEDEAAARAATPGLWTIDSESPDGGWAIDSVKDGTTTEVVGPGYVGGGAWEHGDAQYITHHSPARALREIAAKRRMIAVHRPYVDEPDQACLGCAGGLIWGRCPILRALASIYADRPGYRDEWA